VGAGVREGGKKGLLDLAWRTGDCLASKLTGAEMHLKVIKEAGNNEKDGDRFHGKRNKQKEGGNEAVPRIYKGGEKRTGQDPVQKRVFG